MKRDVKPLAVGLSLLVLAAVPPRMMAQMADDLSRPASRDWPVVYGDWSNTRYSALDQINRTNIQRLGGAWIQPTQSAARSVIVRDGTMYNTSGAEVVAMNAATGATLWSHKVGNSGGKGVGYGDAKVFVGVGLHVIALDAKTGGELWSKQAADINEPRAESGGGPRIGNAPVYARGIVLATIIGDHGIRGRLVALDARTGAHLWTFYTIPGPGELGHDTWPQDSDAWTRGGAGIWQPPTVDPNLGMVYFGTGNAAPQYAGEQRAGDNLFTMSVVALDLKSGAYRWHFQALHHEMWDSDIGAALVLYDAVIDGRPRKALAMIRLDTYLFLLDRETGKPLIPVEERPVPQDPRVKTSATQPYPVGAQPFVPRCVESDGIPPGFVPGCWFDPLVSERPNWMIPFVGARNTMMSYDHQTGNLYAVAAVSPQWIQRFENPWHFLCCRQPPGTKTYSVLAAIDGRTDRIVWKKQLPYSIWGGQATRPGVMTTAGGLLFFASPDGYLQALDAATGDLLWQFQMGSPGSLVASFETGGQQYITVNTRTSVWAFKLDGPVQPKPPPPPPPVIKGFDGAIEDTNSIVLGGVLPDSGWTALKRVEAPDDHLILPYRSRVNAGSKVTWNNASQTTHELVAKDGSWRTGPIAPGQNASVTFDRSGTYAYYCIDHPWSIAELIIE